MQTQFENFADEIIRSSQNNARNSYLVLQSFGRTVTSLSIFANATWPLVTLPHYETRAVDYLTISKAESITFAPVVPAQMRQPYESYTLNNQQWIQEGIDYEYHVSLQNAPQQPEEDVKENAEQDEFNSQLGTNMEGFSVINKAKPIQPFIWTHAPLTHRAVPDTSEGPYVPVWQTYPAPRNSYVVNHNLLEAPEFAELIRSSKQTYMPTMSGVFDNNFILFGNAQTIDVDPKSVLFQPIFRELNRYESQIVGYMIVIKKWYQIFQDVLYIGAKPVVVVLRNSGTGNNTTKCQDKSFTYKVDGATALFMGTGDLHDQRYDDIEVSSPLFQSNVISSECHYTLHVYPTRELEDEFITSVPVFVLLTVLAFCALLALGFYLYDRMTKQQQTNRLKSQAQEERALLRVDHARQAAAAERQLNEFIAHEVRLSCYSTAFCYKHVEIMGTPNC